MKLSLYVADVNFRDFINSFRNIGGAQALVANIKFQEEIFELEQSRVPILNRVREFDILIMARCQYSNRQIKVHDYETREPKTACFGYGMLTHISEIKNK